VSTEQTRVLSVSELNEYIKAKLETDRLLKNVTIKGEISNFTRHSSGHLYFSLKDDNSVIRAVMFKSAAQKMIFSPENDLMGIVSGRIGAYVRDGQYQIYVESMQPEGKGALALAFEQLKRKLASEGLFDTKYKKSLPKIPSCIGVITSPTGAAVRDIINVVSRRFPYAKILIYPALVQGADSARSLINAVEYFDKTHSCDVIIIGRGGGSIEELWSFNDENLARTIFKCSIPVVSAVGHETDFTICDFISDLRAPTPSAAAELAAPDTAKLLKQFSNITVLLDKYLTHKIDAYKSELKHLKESPALTSAGYIIDEKNMQLLRLASDLENAAQMVLKEKRISFTEKVAKLEALNPMSVLTRGFSAVYKDGALVKSVDTINNDDRIRIRMKDGSFDAICDGSSITKERLDSNG